VGLEVLLRGGDELDGGELVAKRGELRSLEGWMALIVDVDVDSVVVEGMFLPSVLEARDDRANESTLYTVWLDSYKAVALSVSQCPNHAT
jgi:hypothetical protein